jgi:hypothetical protein
VPALRVKLLRVASADGAARLMLIVYVWLLERSAEVTLIVIVFGPTLKDTGLAPPEVAALVLMVTVAFTSVVVGVTVMLEVALGTSAAA